MSDDKRGRGRPTTGRPVQVRIPPPVLAVIDRRAAEYEMTRAEIVRRVLTTWTKTPES